MFCIPLLTTFVLGLYPGLYDAHCLQQMRYGQEATILNIAHYFRRYSFLAYQADLVFLPETVAANLGLLAQKCCEQNSKISAAVLEIFLQINQD